MNRDTLKTPDSDTARPERVRVSLRVRLTNSRESFPAVTVDVSRTGVLFLVDDPHLLSGGDGDPVLALARQVDALFGRGLTVIFGGGILRRRMRVVRTLPGEDGVPLLACSFVRPLAGRDCTLLGIPQAEGSWEAWDSANSF